MEKLVTRKRIGPHKKTNQRWQCPRCVLLFVSTVEKDTTVNLRTVNGSVLSAVYITFKELLMHLKADEGSLLSGERVLPKPETTMSNSDFEVISRGDVNVIAARLLQGLHAP